MPGSAAPDRVVAQLVETMRTLAGSHPGFRPAHAKGIVCAGTFHASSDARRVTKASHLQGQSVSTVIRFANASGNPDVHDGQPGVRSLSVKFPLSGDKTADILANSVKDFPPGRRRNSSSSSAPSFRIRPPASPSPTRCRAFSAVIPSPRPSWGV